MYTNSPTLYRPYIDDDGDSDDDDYDDDDDDNNDATMRWAASS